MDGIYQAATRPLGNGTHEVRNNQTMTRRSYRLRSPEAALSLIMFTCGPVEIRLPLQKYWHPHSRQENLFELVVPGLLLHIHGMA
ncbi:hypothetical protein [Paeniglutamicibacter cryotolerans]|uniref:Uncharacterized protein n=1 Tax=Paeniglutamicibacter cryotolerans TaxID=670079 RepID=A0A839QD74_9MICC|nr:hypothetical protein [Paeniglutamicibacter cryotolerans]MBB2993850.1 hypothetical protein [Paeniglutamicibacter cryotolerans]